MNMILGQLGHDTNNNTLQHLVSLETLDFITDLIILLSHRLRTSEKSISFPMPLIPT